MKANNIGILAVGDYAAGGGVITGTGGANTAIGINATSTDSTTSTAFGNGATVMNVLSGVAIGSQAYAGNKDTTTSSIGATAIGRQSYAAGNFTTALGNGTTATNNSDTAVGSGATAIGGNTALTAATAFGAGANAGAASSVALGSSSNVGGAQGVAVGAFANASATNSIAIGGGTNAATAAQAVGVGAIAVGQSTLTASSGDIAIGAGAHATSSGSGGGAVAVGAAANAMSTGDAAFGNGATANGSGTGSLALGGNSKALHENSVALGIGATTDRDGSVSVGSSGFRRQITNVAAGTQANDAATFGQLTATGASVASALGGGSAVNADGTITTPSYTLNGAAVSGVGNALSNLDGRLVTNTNNITTNTNSITALDGRVTSNTTNITQLQSDINSGAVGMVKQAAAGAELTVGAATDGGAVNFAGTAGDRTLGGVANGVNASDAANFGQLTATNNNVTLLDGRVTKNTTDINTLADQIGSGTVGLVQQSAAGANLTVGSTTDGDVVDFHNSTSTARTLTGVAAGGLSAASTDAVNGAQLFATNNNVTALDGRVGIAETNITTINSTLADLGSSLNGAVVYNADKSAIALGGASGTMINNLTAGLIGSGSMQAINGGQIFDMQTAWDKKLADLADSSDIAIGDLKQKFDQLDGKVGDQGKQLDDIDGRVGSIEKGIADGSIGGGTGDGTNADGNVELGKGTTASGKNSSAIGSGSIASGENSSAVGSNASATGKDSTAVGADSSATGNNSVAIGAGSVASQDNTVSFGSEGNERRLTNVADGIDPTDAVNKRQLDGAIAGVNGRIDDIEKIAFGGIAMAGALAGLPQVEPGKTFSLGAGVGNYASYTALALGASARVAPNTIVKMGISTTSGKRSLINAGVGHSW